MTHLCENCRRQIELFYCKSVDAYLCEDCIHDLAEAAFEEELEND